MNKFKLPDINNIEELKAQQKLLQVHIRDREKYLSAKLEHVPGELVKSGLSVVIPGFLTGKITEAGLNGAGKLVNYFFTKPKEKDVSPVIKSMKNMGLFSLARFGFNALVKKKL